MKNCFTANFFGGKLSSESGIMRQYSYNNKGVFAWLGTPDQKGNDTIALDPALLGDPTKCFDDRAMKTAVLWECQPDECSQALRANPHAVEDVVVLLRSDRPIACDSPARLAGGVNITSVPAGMSPDGPRYEQGRTYECLFKLAAGQTLEFTAQQDAVYVFGLAVHRGQISSLRLVNEGKFAGGTPETAGISFVEHEQRRTDAPAFKPKLLAFELGLSTWALVFALLITTAIFPAETAAISLIALLSAVVFVVGSHALIDLLRLIVEWQLAPRFRSTLDLIAADLRTARVRSVTLE